MEHSIVGYSYSVDTVIQEVSMADFIGSKCVICNEYIKAGDDVVVCPDCGTPYHRACYQHEGKCINTELHEKGGSWQDICRQEQHEDACEDKKICPVCGTENKLHSFVCEKCGEFFIKGEGINEHSGAGPQQPFGGMAFDPSDPFCGMDPEEKFEQDVELGEIAEYVNTNKLYYLSFFKRLKETGRKISMNIICLFFPQLYFANRKMLLMTVLTIIFTTVMHIPSFIIDMAALGMADNLISLAASSSFKALACAASYINLGFEILLCLFANWIYYKHVIKRVKQIKDNSESLYDAHKVIRVSGGTSVLSVVIALAAQIILLFFLVLFVSHI